MLAAKLKLSGEWLLVPRITGFRDGEAGDCCWVCVRAGRRVRGKGFSGVDWVVKEARVQGV